MNDTTEDAVKMPETKIFTLAVDGTHIHFSDGSGSSAESLVKTMSIHHPGKTCEVKRLYTADQLRAYADAKCSALRAERDALAEFSGVLDCSQTTQALIRMLIERDQRGRAKYGTTLDRTDLSHNEWLQHMAEEMLDGAGYALAAMRTAG